MESETWHIIISGKVQGVYYRQNTLDNANRLRLTGWVRNLNNGDVEIKVTGTPENLESLLSWCRIGPEGARIDNLEKKKIEPENFNDFRIVR